MMNHPSTQQVTAQQQHQRTTAHQVQHRQPAPQGSFNPKQFPQVAPQAQITHDQMMLINSMQALMGTNQNQRSNSAKKHRKQEERKRLPSLHIGNLPTKFYDLDLFKTIKTMGFAVVKALVVVDKKTNKSLNYGYAQFLTEEEASRCQKVLNNHEIEGKVITVSLQQMDSKPNPKANILVRNLAASVTQKQVFDFYAKFGQIQKCKLECFADGISRGFAYVQFEKEDDAVEAVKKTNGQELEGKPLEVFQHVKRSDDSKTAGGQSQSNNVFVQGIAKNTTDVQLKQLFQEFGEISSCVVSKADSDDSLSNNGFVCFKDAKAATVAVDKLNKQKAPHGGYLFVSHHVAKRQNDLAQDKTKTMITQNINKNFESNLFVNHLPIHVTEDDIMKLFVPFGAIISIKLKVKGNDTSRFKYAYVLYEKVESCQVAIRSLDKSRPFGNTPIDVEFWVSKVDLVAEREQKQKEYMQKYISSAIYNIRNELMGGRKPYRGGRGGRQTAGGRGARPQHSADRKSSKDNRPKSQPK